MMDEFKECKESACEVYLNSLIMEANLLLEEMRNCYKNSNPYNYLYVGSDGIIRKMEQKYFTEELKLAQDKFSKTMKEIKEVKEVLKK